MSPNLSPNPSSNPSSNPPPDGSNAESTTPILELLGDHARIRLNRPREHNRIDPADLPVLMAHFDRIDAEPALRAVVVTGTGDRTFSSGYTLSSLAGLADEAVGFETMLDRLENLPVPTIAALNGSLYGGATDLALACDFRVGLAGTRLVMPASRVGLHYYPGGMRRFVERLGVGVAKELFLLGEPVPAERLRDWGYLTALVDPAGLETEVNRLVAVLAGGAPAAIRGMKRHLNAIARGQYDAAAIGADYRRSLGSSDLQEGLAALAAKRPPRFTGR